MNFREYRKRHQITQRQLAQRLGLDRSVLSQYERGTRLPRAETLERLILRLGQRVEQPCPSEVSPARLRRFFPDLRSCLKEPVRSPAWRRLLESHPDLMTYLGPPPESLETWIRVDSTFECLAWLQLHRAGAEFCFESPVLKGCPGPPLCHDGQSLGLRRLPCLFDPDECLPFVCWPQVEMRTSWKTYRVDALVAAQVRGRTVWMVVELDGPGHRSDLDERRTESLGLKVLRFDSSHIYGLEFRERLLKRISSEFKA